MIAPTAERITQLPPHDFDLELTILSCLLHGGHDGMDVVGEVRPLLSPLAFYRTSHRRIYEACLALHDHGEPCAPQLLVHELERRGTLEKAGGKEALGALADVGANPAHAAHYAGQLQDVFLRRRMLELAYETEQRVHDGTPGSELLQRHEQETLRLRDAHEVARALSVSEATAEILRQVDDPTTAPPGLACGLSDIDTLTGGFRNGNMVVVAGRTSMGKTTFALNVVRHACVENGVATLLVSTEMSVEEVLRNVLAAMARVDTKMLHDPRFLREEDRQAIRSHAPALQTAPLRIYDASPVDVSTIRSQARRMRLRGGLGLIVVDYIQQLQPTTSPGQSRASSREQEVAAMSRALKSLARELSVPVIVVAQLNRMAEAREDHRPRLSDLRESGAIENDADLVLLLYRPEYYARNEPERAATKGTAEVNVAKQRNGPTGTVRLAFRAEHARFDNLARPSTWEERS